MTAAAVHEVGRGERRAQHVRLTRRALRLLLWAWIPSALVVIGLLMASHSLALPRPSSHDPRLAAALSALRAPEHAGDWLAVHVMYAQCRCSQRLIEHLATRPRLPGVDEVVLLAGSDEALAARLRGAGYRLQVIEPAELERRYHVTAAPLLAVLDASPELRYLGGYTRTKQGPAPQDAAIIATLMREERVSELPLLGCAVSQQLQAMLDPLGLQSLTRRQ